MRRTSRELRAAFGVFAGAALFATVLPAGPAAASVPSGESVSSDASVGAAGDFWTAERMREAQPLRLPDAAALAREQVPGGEKLEIPPAASTDSVLGPLETGAPWSGGGEVEKTAGRVFFTFDGRPASCSGNAVTSDNESTVITAGHCVKMEGSWHKDWVFVPGYHDGEAPYGKWNAAKTLTTPQWEADEDLNYDVGAAVVKPLNGRKLTETVGGQGLAFNSGYSQPMYAFGYPAADPYDGEKLVHCAGTSFRDVLLTQDHALSCDMTGGSSGGPWFTEFDEASGSGLQASVNSFGYTFLPDTMFGPYFGDDARQLYEKAQSS